jgi:hypothetical protein
MSLQNQFEKFNDNIRIKSSKLEELREKRDILLGKLKSDVNLSTFEEFSQGSYGIYTEVEPINKDYDIDVGLRFNSNKADYNPVELKKKIKEILKNHTEYGATIKNPCVTVTYKKDGDIAFHVDLVVYTYEDKNDKSSQLYMDRGKENSLEENKYWEKADPINLLDKIDNKFNGDDREQYRRIIRYLKRWKNLKFSSDGNNEVPGIGVTLLTYNLFSVHSSIDSLTLKTTYSDIDSLINLVEKIKNEFRIAVDDQNNLKYTIALMLPVEPYTDVFSKMTLNQTTNLKEKIFSLYDDLKEIKLEIDTVKQCEYLKKIFGDSFPVPEKEEESTSQRNYIPSSSVSGN